MSRPVQTLLALALSCALAVGAVLVAATGTSAAAPGPGTQAQTLPSISMSGVIHEGTSTITVISSDGFQTRTLQDQDANHTIYYERAKTRSVLAPSQPTGTDSHNSVLLQEPIGDGTVFTNYEAQPVDWADCVTREADGSTTSESCELTLTIPAGTPSFTGSLLVACRQGPADATTYADVPLTAIAQTDWLPTLEQPCVQSIPVVYTGSSSPPTAAFAASTSGTSHQWAFDGSTSSAVAPASVASYHWTFGDGATQVTTTPTTDHVYPDDSSRTASLVVVDSNGVSSPSVSHDLVAPSLVVNSTGDAPATDPSKGCSTGGTVGTPPAPECTLRAAIQSLDAGVGGTKIAFALPAGSTTITAASPLPDITKAGATIDGTETSGIPTISASPLHIKNASGVTITKISVVASGDYGVFFDGSPGATLTSSSIGVSPDGVSAAAKLGVVMSSSGVVTVGGPNAGNVIAGTGTALSIAPTAAITSLTVQGNSIGESADGALLSESGEIGFAVFASSDTPVTGAVIGDNRIAGFATNLSLAGAGVVAPQITGNRIGVAVDQDTLLGAAHANLRLDGVPGAVVTGNQIAGATGYDVLVSGSVQVSVQPSGADGQVLVQYLYPGGSGLASPLTGPIVGTHDTISGNQIGPVTRHSTPSASGVTVWNLPNDTTISGNTVLDHDSDEIDVVGGSGARLSVTGNTVGAGAGATAGFGKGISLQGAPAPTVSQNTVGGVFAGIALAPDVSGAVISGNTIGFGADGSTASAVGFGIQAGGPSATVGPNNTVGNASRAGIYVSGSGVHVVSNRVGAAKFGSSAATNIVGIEVSAAASGTVVGGSGVGNTVVGNGTGLQLLGTSTEVGNNTFGLITSGALGNGTGIDAQAAASIHDNTIANSSVVGVAVKNPAVVTLLHNSIYGTTGGTGVTGATAAPTVVEADRVVHGSSARTFLVLRNVPTSTGTIEVFGNANCGDPEARFPLFTTPVTGEATRVISIAGRTDLSGLTVMVTVNGRTSTISNCGTAAAGVDSDGDGMPDAVETAYPASADPAASAKDSAFVADNQQWVLLTATTGTLSNVSPIDDPSPSGHPGATFPLGLIDWTLSGIDPGTIGTVMFTLPGTVINGWWKYSPHHDPQFYDYGYSSIAGYGAKVTAENLLGFGLSTVVSVLVPDGGVGDDDGLENGVIRDPAAPAVAPSDATPVIPLPGPGITATAARSSRLPQTGSDPSGGVVLGVLTLLIGLLVIGGRSLARRRRANAS
jgi:CSLREA domain-containing protein/LPXTG-motif cell wall-anchored protein